MEPITKKIDGDLTVSEELTLLGMVTGNITILKGGVLDFQGTCNKDLILEEGSKVHLGGTVNGNVVNRAGELHVSGTVNGYVHTDDRGKTVIDPGAKIKN